MNPNTDKELAELKKEAEKAGELIGKGLALLMKTLAKIPYEEET